MNADQELVGDLPEHLAERTRFLGETSARSPGEFVLYWLQHAMRAHENPALDVALTAARHLRLPLLIYQELPESTPYASDRHHLFVLEGARDLQEQFRRRGLHYAFHLERRDHRVSHLRSICERAAVAISEDLPVEPLRSWTEELAATTTTPLLCVDTACVAPPRLVGQAYERAFQFRQATQALYDQRVPRIWQDVEPDLSGALADLPFAPLDLATNDLASLVNECEIDHAIGAVPHTPGGSAAGYARWDEFKSQGLEAYARLRNDPLIDGTGRLSPYLHYGMVSPLRLAREAAESRTEGAGKFLDELLVWRELAYTFCFFRRDHRTLAALPDWARETLAAHAADPRPAIHAWETLARGRTGDGLWDAAQRSLLIHGELHNNVRMTWGKALLNWTPDAQAALALMIDLNHRYALDGQDPASFGGILWCLGQFDRPFPPDRQILGTVRDRSTTDHAKRLDPHRYLERTTRPLYEPRPRVAVIGAGISGLMCARTLRDHGLRVTVFEKSRGVGGRMATRRIAEGSTFDHGAQYFTVRDRRFQRYVNSWVQDALVAPWEGRIVTLTGGRIELKETLTARFVGVPGMSAVCKHLAADLEVRLETRVAPPTLDDGVWQLAAENGQSLGAFDCVITCAPAPQSAELLASAPEFQRQAQATTMNGCWAAMCAFEDSLELPFDGAFVHESPLSWIARNDSKPHRVNGQETQRRGQETQRRGQETQRRGQETQRRGQETQRRGRMECWVLHASADWTSQHLEEHADDVLPQLIEAFWRATGAARRPPAYSTAHRWRYAIPATPLVDRCLFDPLRKIGACGDWCSGPRVEGAFLSGLAVAGRVLTQSWK